MAEHFIDSLADSRLDPYRNVRQTNFTRWSGRFIAEGKLVVERLLTSGLAVESVLVSDRRRDAIATASRRDVELYVVPQVVAEQLVGYNFHAGVLACARRPPTIELETIASKAGRLTFLVCPKITGPENLGTLVRLCHAFEVDALVLGRGSADPFSRRVVRVSMGSVFCVPVVVSRDAIADVTRARSQHGVETWAAVACQTGDALDRCARPPRLAVMLGNEFEGLSDEWLTLADRQVAIPMALGADSLNVACAASILLYHLARPAQT
jgi:tRNA G18 (ribose-2'-O)-methylase SpoU